MNVKYMFNGSDNPHVETPAPKAKSPRHAVAQGREPTGPLRLKSGP